MIDLSDVTFIIPLRIDSVERFHNLTYLINYFERNLITNVILLESDAERKINFKSNSTSINFDYLFVKDESPFFHRTKLLNIMISRSQTPYVANYDCDVLLPLQAYERSYALLREHDFVYPFNGLFLDIPPAIKAKLFSNEISICDINISECGILGKDSVGGAIFAKRASYIESGLENERFIAYGFEDQERISRWITLGYRIVRLDNPLYHMCHPRGINSRSENPYFNNNIAEFEKVRRLSADELRAYIKSWPWGAR